MPYIIPGLRVRTQDFATDVGGVQEIRVDNGTLTNDGGGSVSILTGGGGAGGHTIQDLTTTFPARTNLKFLGSPVVVTDDIPGDATVVTITALAPVADDSYFILATQVFG